MSVQNIGAGIPLPASAPTGRFFLPGASAFADTLSIGQIIQGRVLRGFDENRYLVAFAGDERVVDSSIPLTAGEILYGRVIGVGDRVELQRVYAGSQDKNTRAETAAVEPRSTLPATVSGSALDSVLQRYRIELTDADRATLAKAARAVEDPEAMGMASAMLSKLGLPQTTVLLEAMYRAQFATGPTRASMTKADSESIPQVIASAQQTAELQASSIQQLAGLVGKILEGSGTAEVPQRTAFNPASPSAGSSVPVQYAVPRDQTQQFASDDARRKAQESLAARILNAQTGGVVAHRSGFLPLIVGGRLVEVSFALFEQRRPANQAQGLQHRQVLFSVQTEQMGRVEVLARVTGGHVRVQISTDNEHSTAQSARHADLLKSSLSESGWNVDEVAYATSSANPLNAAVRSVIEHVVSLDSLNRLV